MAKQKKKKRDAKIVYSTPVEHMKHRDKRVNIPTEELRDFVAEDEKAPQKMLYPRDPSLDPQLVWKGKDEQDSKPLEVPIVPIYIQEKIHPQAIVEDLRAQARKEKPEDQVGLFDDFNGINFEEMIDFYQHEQNWTNRAILGDSLLVMTSLSEKEGLKGKVQSIYFDPPYGIKFGSNWQVSTRRKDVKDGKVEDTTRQPEQIKAFRDTWENHIHSYLAYLRDRLVVCRDLLTESGSLFVQIGEENVHLVRSVLDEVFGAENFCSQIAFRTATSQPTTLISCVYDFVLWYGKVKRDVKYRTLNREREYFEKISTFGWIELQNGQERTLSAKEKRGEIALPEGGKLFKDADITLVRKPDEPYQHPRFKGKEFPLSLQLRYVDGIERLVADDRVVVVNDRLCGKRYESDIPYVKYNSVWDDTMQGTFELTKDPKKYVVQTAPKVIQRCLLMTTEPGDLVLDPTCGSGTTAFVAEQWGRRWITIDTSRVALALARTRLMGAKFPYYLLSDSADGAQKEAEITGKIPSSIVPKRENDIKKGFVYRRIPHISLKSITNDRQIDAIYAKRQGNLDAIRAELNTSLKQSWEDWQVPGEADQTWPHKTKQFHAEWWKLYRERRKEIDDLIARHSDTELLYDQPYEDNKRIRVTGPFTVESLSPHRVLSTADDDRDGKFSEQEAMQQQDFVSMILDNLRKAGVQNTVRKERLKFDRLDSFAGVWLHGSGEYSENGKRKRVVISIGPEHGTVGPQLIKEAAKEAVLGVGFDLLIVCGFAFDPHVSEEAKRYGKLTVLIARMNPDLAMGDELLKKTGAGNLFMVFGEPDMEVKKQKDGKIIVTIKGLDVYDPTTGQIRSSTTDDIACWFIDTNYNGESFFVRHAYFTGADEPYEKLKRALRAEIDEAAWSALYSTKSRPFDTPITGKIAVKVINHFGDEVLKVYDL
ncbi:MAG: DNA methyltransferase [Bacteroidota bacterium]